MAKIRRSVQDGQVQESFVNPDQVQYVCQMPQGSYVAFDNDLVLDDNKQWVVHPKGILSPDTVEDVIERLNRPYKADLKFKMWTLVVSMFAIAVAVVLAIVVS